MLKGLHPRLARSLARPLGAVRVKSTTSGNVSRPGAGPGGAAAPVAAGAACCAPSAPELQKDTFPFARINDSQFERMSDQLLDSSLPLKAFFAQHRPLMAMPREPQQPADARDVMFVHVWQPKGVSLHESGFQAVPQEIASEVGAFSVAAQAASPSSTNDFASSPAAAYADAAAAVPSFHMAGRPRNSASRVPGNVHSIHETISLIGSILERYNSQGGKGSLVQIPLVNGEQGLVYEEPYDGEDVDATSVRRKRKLKMNRHKYRKRLKAQRTLRRRLGK